VGLAYSDSSQMMGLGLDEEGIPPVYDFIFKFGLN
jgi:hypothetical protein